MAEAIAAFVAAKGHSARVPRKNMRDFGGAPLFHTILRTLFDAERIGQVVLDSDSDEILDSAAAAFPDITLIRRPEELIGDDTPMNLLIQNCFEVTGVEVLLQTHATNPHLRSETIDEAVERFLGDEAATSLFSVTSLQTRLYWDDLRPINHDPAELIPTQDLPVIYEENSNIYVMTREGFLGSGHRVTDKTIAFPMDAMEAIDIDNEVDFSIALALLEARS